MDKVTDKWIDCTKKKLCNSAYINGVYGVDWKINYIDGQTLHNFILQYNLCCEDDSFTAWISSVFFIGEVVGSLIFPAMAD